jgi:hypothetical protein
VAGAAYSYELHDRAGKVSSTGRLSLEKQPAPGTIIRLGMGKAFVLDVHYKPEAPHLILEAL